MAYRANGKPFSVEDVCAICNLGKPPRFSLVSLQFAMTSRAPASVPTRSPATTPATATTTLA